MGVPSRLSPLTSEDFQRLIHVSRETLVRLEAYAELLIKWQAKLNLVSSASLGDIWRRHMLDSAQLLGLAPAAARTWLDLGSGAGFPGLVLAIMGVAEVHVVESNGRKCAFLEAAASATGTTNLVVRNQRIEDVEPWVVDVVTARALAPLPRLAELAYPFLGPRTICIFPKGQDVENELTEAGKYWNMTIDRVPSRSGFSGTILRLQGLSRA